MLGIMTFISCKRELYSPGQISLNTTPPGIVTNIKVVNGPGSAKLSYTLPGDDDLSYVKATYKVNDKVTREAIASYYNNELTLEGFGEVKPYKVVIVAVDQSKNESAPVEVIVNPEKAPVHMARESLTILQNFGGIYLHWLNPEKKDLNIEVDVDDPENKGFFIQNNVIYSDEADPFANIRGFKPEPRTFRITIVDRWGNRSEPLVAEITPLEEIQIDPKKFVATINFPENSSVYTKEKAFNGVIGNEGLISQTPNIPRPQLTIDLGRTVKFSRMVQWQRDDPSLNYLYNHLNTRTFKIWASNTPPSTDGWDYTGWTLIHDGEIIKPSGLPLSQLTSDDRQQAAAGHTVDFSIDMPAYRYFRYELTNNWSNNLRFQVSEIKIYGNYVD